MNTQLESNNFTAEKINPFIFNPGEKEDTSSFNGYTVLRFVILIIIMKGERGQALSYIKHFKDWIDETATSILNIY